MKGVGSKAKPVEAYQALGLVLYFLLHLLLDTLDHGIPTLVCTKDQVERQAKVCK
jgi:hypothetical protein